MSGEVKLAACPFCKGAMKFDKHDWFAHAEHNMGCIIGYEKFPPADVDNWNTRAAIEATRPPVVTGQDGEGGWQGIESAPKDGTRVLLWIEPTKIWMPFEWKDERWMGDDFPLNMAWPTHWMPLPKAPGQETPNDCG